MKKFFGRLFEGLIAIFLVPIFGVVLAIVLPFDYIKYKRFFINRNERNTLYLQAAAKILNCIMKSLKITFRFNLFVIQMD